MQEVIDINVGLTNEQALRLASNLGFRDELSGYAALQIKRLYNLFIGVDATQVEVNPFGETPDGQGKHIHQQYGFDIPCHKSF